MWHPEREPKPDHHHPPPHWCATHNGVFIDVPIGTHSLRCVDPPSGKYHIFTPPASSPGSAPITSSSRKPTYRILERDSLFKGPFCFICWLGQFGKGVDPFGDTLPCTWSFLRSVNPEDVMKANKTEIDIFTSVGTGRGQGCEGRDKDSDR